MREREETVGPLSHCRAYHRPYRCRRARRSIGRKGRERGEREGEMKVRGRQRMMEEAEGEQEGGATRRCTGCGQRPHPCPCRDGEIERERPMGRGKRENLEGEVEATVYIQFCRF